MAEYRKGVSLQRDGQWYIRDEQDGTEVLIPGEILTALGGELEPDATVEYTRQRADKRSLTLIVKNFRRAGEIPLLPDPSIGPIPEGFINPYNFVPLVDLVPRSAPVSHEYFRGHSGQLICSLTLKTPFFTPDSAGTNRDPSDHETFKLLRDPQGHALIPGSALKGMIRSVAEVLSNSCLSVVDLEARFSWRNVDSRRWRNYWSGRQIGVVMELPGDGQPGKIAPAKAAKVYFEELPEGSKDGDEATAVIGATRSGRPKAIQVKLGHTSQATPGYLKITEVPENNDERRTQRFVYDVEEDQDKWLSFNEAIERAYHQTTEASRNLDDRHRKIFRHIGNDFYTNADRDDPSHGLRRKRHRLEAGDIVYFVRESGAIVRLGPVELSRVLYEKGVIDGIPEQLRPCREPMQLCPCCRLFGWIPPSRRERERQEEESRAGFISISPARTEKKLTGADIHEAQATLRPLGQPHASAANFYLQEPGDPAAMGHYSDKEFEIRGRKFYWHQEGSRAAYTDSRNNGQPQRDNQNKTVELLKAGTVFHFVIAFENLSESELGLLLVAVQPSLLGAHLFCHKTGMGKPLGLGSAEIRITKVERIDRAKRYGSLWETGIEQPTNIRQWVGPFVNTFVQQALRDQQKEVSADPQQARQSFARLPHIEPLLSMLDWKRRPSGVSYPPGPPKAVEESFRWFMEFKTDTNGQLLTPQEIMGSKEPPEAPKRQPPFPGNP